MPPLDDVVRLRVAESADGRHRQQAGLLAAEDIWPSLETWSAAGQRCAMVTLVGIDGAAPRALGAQMAVCEDGTFTGYLSGGCLEEAVALEAVQAIRAGQNRLVRYGRGSPYIDVRLACGGGLDVYIDQTVSAGLVGAARRFGEMRNPYELRIDLDRHQSSVAVCSPFRGPGFEAVREERIFRRPYVPALRLEVIGSSPSATAIAHLGAVFGMDARVVSPNGGVIAEARRLGIEARELDQVWLDDAAQADAFTAAVCVFHEHEREPAVLSALLRSDCFYIAALGSRIVHAARSEALAGLGVQRSALTRIHAPCGTIANAKTRAVLAVSVVAEIAARAKELGYVV